MGRLSKEDRAYNDGMAFAYRIAKERGVEELGVELKARGIASLPLNVSYKNYTKTLMKGVDLERRIIGVASAKTLVEVLRMPISMVKDYLINFTRIHESFLNDPKLFEQEMDRMEKNYGLMITSLEVEEEIHNGK